MINNEKVGVGIVTFNREHLLEKLFDSVTTLALHNVLDEIVIVNDGNPIDKKFEYVDVINNETNLGVGPSKNKAFRFLMERNCDHFFIIEDDIFIKDLSVFEKYIEASKISGLEHLNFSQHGWANKTYWQEEKNPNPRLVINYGNVSLAFYPHCVGAFSYYSKNCLEKVGLIDENYYNACEHVDHTYQIIQKGMHPPFWWFADIANSWEWLGEEWSIDSSTISSNPNHEEMMRVADSVFYEKHGVYPRQIPMAGEEEVLKFLKNKRK